MGEVCALLSRATYTAEGEHVLVVVDGIVTLEGLSYSVAAMTTWGIVQRDGL